MNVNDGTMTSSPGPMPAVASARCRPVVHEVVATPCFAPTYAATAFSNSATFGPCVTQPLLIDSYGARASSSPSAGLVMGIFIFLRVSVAICAPLLRHRARERPAPPGDELAHPVSERRLRAESEQFLRSPCVAVPSRRQCTGGLRLEFQADGASGHFEQQLGEIAHPRFHAGADVDDSVAAARLAGEHVRAHHV